MATCEGNPFGELDAKGWLPPADLLETLQTPVLCVDLARVRDNVRSVLRLTGGPNRWRPHLKTTKLAPVWNELLRAGVRQFKCATTREAAVLADVARRAGVEVDLLVAYPLRGPALHRLGEIAAASPHLRLSVLVEDPTVLDEVSPRLGVFVDVNPGMNRTGIPLHDVQSIAAVVAAVGVRFRGLHCYDGHQHAPDLAERRALVADSYERLLEVVARLEAENFHTEEVITAGTPACSAALAYAPFAQALFTHRVSPGTVVFHDARTEVENPDLDLAPAAVVWSRVVSHPTATIATCDAGSKSVAAEGGDPCAFVIGDDSLVALTPSEEHLPWRGVEGRLPARGDVLALVPWHICPTVNLADEVVLLEPGADPRVVPVDARGREVTVASRPFR